MVDPVQALSVARVAQPPAPGVFASGTNSTEATRGKDFRSVLVDSLAEVDRLQREADDGVHKLITGESDNVVEVFSAVNKAGIAFDLLMEIRNKLTSAYEEIQQIRV